MKSAFNIPKRQDTDAFYEGRRSERTPIVYNDTVAIKEGERKGQQGSVVGLVESEPEARYTVELFSGQGELHLRFSELIDEEGA
jgi:hypothetical protein